MYWKPGKVRKISAVSQVRYLRYCTPVKGLVINASYFRDLYNYKENIVDTDFPRWDFRLDQQITTGKQGIITNQDSNNDRYVIDLFATYNTMFAKNIM